MHQHIVAYTLVDVSDTSALQQQNYNTLLQTIALRANPLSYTYTTMGYQSMEDYNFGEDFGAQKNVWMVSFVVEQMAVYGNKSGQLGGLIDDLHQVPVITNLMDSATITPAVFDTKNTKTKNLYFYLQDL